MKIEIINEEDKIVFDALVSGVREYNFENIGNEISKPLSVVSRDSAYNLIGGVSGRTIYNQFLIEVLWVDKVSRGSGLGSRLMEFAEIEAKKRGCIAAQVDTLSFQAPNFYEKLGFEIVGTVTGIKGSPDRYFLLKIF